MIENKKYKLTNKTINHNGFTLYRIKALRDFGDVDAGDLGGYIQSEDNLSHEGDCWVYDRALVYRDAWVSGDACVLDNAKVFGSGKVYRDAKVYGDAVVAGYCQVHGDAKIYGNTRLYGNRKVDDNSMILELSNNGVLNNEYENF